MKVPLGWLRDYVDINLPVAQLVERLTLAGLEVGSVRLIGLVPPEGLRVKSEDAGPVWAPDKVILGQIVSVDPHPNADRLTLPVVDIGGGKTKALVTGATNIKVGDRGQKVVVALSGSVLYDGHAEQPVLKELKPTKIRGVPSDAMVCSYKELGIADEHEGIILLDHDAPPPGTPAAEVLGDIVLELDVLPNMARCLSLVGVAREVAALTDRRLRPPPQVMHAGAEAIEGKVAVEIEDAKLCARYAAALLKGVRVGPSPEAMQRRLMLAGMRPISNLVDVTNYVMLEWGQPLHAFDYDKLVERVRGKMPVITVRVARPGEVLTTLDGMKRELTPENLVIADATGPVAIAGVMGGADTELSPATKNVLLEAANFNFISVRRTMRALNLPSEASMRFSKGIHPELVRPAAERAAELMHEHGGASICRGLVDNYPAPLPRQVVNLDMREVERQLGIAFSLDEAARILRALEFEVQPTGPSTLRATVPPHRLDIQVGSADLIEELARIHGYDRLPATLLADRLPEQHTNQGLVFEERVRDILVNTGLQEVITYSLTMPEREQPLGLVKREYVRLLNPISSERVVMRQTVLAGVLEIAAANLRHADDVRLFEIGPVFLTRPGEKLPEEPRRLAFVLTGKRRSEFWADSSEGQTVRPSLDFFDIKGIVEALAGDLHLGDVTYQPSSAPYLHPGRATDLTVDGNVLGSFGQLHPKVAEAYSLGDRAILAGELDVELLQTVTPGRYAYTAVPRFPAALRDIAVVVDRDVTAERLVKEIRAAGGDLLRQVRLFDIYQAGSIPGGKKSLAFALTYQADDRTLTDKEVDRAHKKIEDRLRHTLKALIRGKE
jgi:phenylalanyl-tRNA synthetase beta chain